ncbi:MAG TPA: hypothetical protein VF794_24295, partial [Archangium sp.]|uniref:hypothetical protein n=1 Tax=Archangium sp. TaxID=1872627 RepID=UPI002ED95A99
MKGYSDELPEMVRRRLVSCGDVGVAWMNGLDRLVSDLAEQWELTLGRILTGGTAAFVAEAITADGTSAVLKLKIPGEDPTRSELRMLLAARGRGYPLVLKHDETKDALLLERLGTQLAELELPVRAQLEIICSTLEEAWISGASAGGFQTGAEKATALAGGITQMWRELGQPCSERLITRALEFTAR